MGFPFAQFLLGLLFLIDVKSDAAEVARDSGFVSDQAGAQADPQTLSARASHLEGDVEAAARLDRTVDGLLGS